MLTMSDPVLKAKSSFDLSEQKGKRKTVLTARLSLERGRETVLIFQMIYIPIFGTDLKASKSFSLHVNSL